jgi:hypothetical protein
VPILYLCLMKLVVSSALFIPLSWLELVQASAANRTFDFDRARKAVLWTSGLYLSITIPTAVYVFLALYFTNPHAKKTLTPAILHTVASVFRRPALGYSLG